MKAFVFLVSMSFLLLSCRDNEGYSCFTNPQPIILKLVDSKGINLVETDDLKVSDLKISPQNSSYKPNLDFKEIQNHLIAVNGTGWNNGAEKFNISSPIKNFTIKVISKELTGKCGGYIIEKVDFENVDVSNAQSVYTVILKN